MSSSACGSASVCIGCWSGEPQIPPLRYAPVGMTNLRVVASVEIGLWRGGTAGPSTSLRFGRDDKSEGSCFDWDWFVAEGTADPSTSLRCGRDDKSNTGCFGSDWFVAEGTAGPSTSLRSGRDDKSESGCFGLHWLPVRRTADPPTPLRPVGMTKLRVVLRLGLVCGLLKPMGWLAGYSPHRTCWVPLLALKPQQITDLHIYRLAGVQK
jgi:hypothetical protein